MNLSMINQARELKAKLDKAQKELANITVEGVGGKGMVKVAMNGQQKIKAVTISPEAVDPMRVKKLEEYVLKAVEDATEKSQKEAAKQLKGLTGGLKIPGLF
jgi:DNA-binding YbaB/EbfC family protein